MLPKIEISGSDISKFVEEGKASFGHVGVKYIAFLEGNILIRPVAGYQVSMNQGENSLVGDSPEQLLKFPVIPKVVTCISATDDLGKRVDHLVTLA